MLTEGRIEKAGNGRGIGKRGAEFPPVPFLEKNDEKLGILLTGRKLAAKTVGPNEMANSRTVVWCRRAEKDLFSI